MHLLYVVISTLLAPFVLVFALAMPKLRPGFFRRLGFYPRAPRPWPPSRSPGPRIWFHGASAGDVLAIAPIIAELRGRRTDLTIIVSSMTNSGAAMAELRLGALADAVTYVPFDLPGATRRAVRALAPDLLVLEYAELWPCLIEAARRSGAKVALTNGRISERLLGRYRLLHALIGNQLAKLDLLLMREEREAERALSLGAPAERVAATGNTKFDHVSEAPPLDRILALSRDLGVERNPHVLAASTGPSAHATVHAPLPSHASGPSPGTRPSPSPVPSSGSRSARGASEPAPGTEPAPGAVPALGSGPDLGSELAFGSEPALGSRTAPGALPVLSARARTNWPSEPNQAAHGCVSAHLGDHLIADRALGAAPLWVAGSTHEGEEAILIGVFGALRVAHRDLRLLIAPRYVERADRVLAIARSAGFRAALRSDASARAAADVVVLDSIGELTSAYALASFVFVGGSFVRRGGQNILEPAGQGRLVLFGPHMANFRDSVEVLVGRGGIQVGDANHLLRVASALLARPEELRRLGEMARSAVQALRGASARNATRLAALV